MSNLAASSTRAFSRILGRSIFRLSPINFKMASTQNQFEVIHDKENSEFYIQIGKDKAVLQYEIVNKGTGEADLHHTEVPDSFRGKGVAKILAKEALDYFAKEKKVPFQLTCTYLQKYAKENTCPEYNEFIQK